MDAQWKTGDGLTADEKKIFDNEFGDGQEEPALFDEQPDEGWKGPSLTSREFVKTAATFGAGVFVGAGTNEALRANNAPEMEALFEKLGVDYLYQPHLAYQRLLKRLNLTEAFESAEIPHLQTMMHISLEIAHGNLSNPAHLDFYQPLKGWDRSLAWYPVTSISSGEVDDRLYAAGRVQSVKNYTQLPLENTQQPEQLLQQQPTPEQYNELIKAEVRFIEEESRRYAEAYPLQYMLLGNQILIHNGHAYLDRTTGVMYIGDISRAMLDMVRMGNQALNSNLDEIKKRMHPGAYGDYLATYIHNIDAVIEYWLTGEDDETFRINRGTPFIKATDADKPLILELESKFSRFGYNLNGVPKEKINDLSYRLNRVARIATAKAQLDNDPAFVKAYRESKVPQLVFDQAARYLTEPGIEAIKTSINTTSLSRIEATTPLSQAMLTMETARRQRFTIHPLETDLLAIIAKRRRLSKSEFAQLDGDEQMKYIAWSMRFPTLLEEQESRNLGIQVYEVGETGEDEATALFVQFLEKTRGFGESDENNNAKGIMLFVPKDRYEQIKERSISVEDENVITIQISETEKFVFYKKEPSFTRSGISGGLIGNIEFQPESSLVTSSAMSDLIQQIRFTNQEVSNDRQTGPHSVLYRFRGDSNLEQYPIPEDALPGTLFHNQVIFTSPHGRNALIARLPEGRDRSRERNVVSSDSSPSIGSPSNIEIRNREGRSSFAIVNPEALQHNNAFEVELRSGDIEEIEEAMRKAKPGTLKVTIVPEIFKPGDHKAVTQIKYLLKINYVDMADDSSQHMIAMCRSIRIAQ